MEGKKKRPTTGVSVKTSYLGGSHSSNSPVKLQLKQRRVNQFKLHTPAEHSPEVNDYNDKGISIMSFTESLNANHHRSFEESKYYGSLDDAKGAKPQSKKGSLM